MHAGMEAACRGTGFTKGVLCGAQVENGFEWAGLALVLASLTFYLVAQQRLSS